ncbi:MAG: helix-turn-helix transcriptional regulator [Clostridia bacterium]|nr:helix-turn-helix transcriptional regulator [Clostridia bacterium]
MTNINYTFKFGNIKFSADIGSSFSAATMPEEVRRSEAAKLPHYHAKYELFFVGHEPLILHTVDGVEEYSDCVVCVPPFLSHFAERTSDYGLLFSFEAGGQKPSDFSVFCGSFFSAGGVFSFDYDPAFDIYLPRLGEVIKSESSLGNEAASSILSLVFYSIYTGNTKKHRRDFSVKESYLIIIERMINSYSLTPSREVTLSAVASELHLGKKQTSRIIYKYFKKSLAELINEKRLGAAAHLLLTTDMTISEIAKTSNFNSENYFFIQFKKAFGCTPLAYRKKLKAKI